MNAPLPAEYPTRRFSASACLELRVPPGRFGAGAQVVAERECGSPPFALVVGDVQRVPTRRPLAKDEPTVSPRAKVDVAATLQRSVVRAGERSCEPDEQVDQASLQAQAPLCCQRARP